MKNTPPRVNYDLIAHLYDEPGRDYTTDPYLIEFLNERSDGSLTGIRILDMGCGTGKQLTANHQSFPAMEMVGLDLFEGMLRQARNRCPDIKWIKGDSTDTRFEANGFDYITNQFSYHHIEDKWKLIQETYRILRPNGRFVITNLDPWSMTKWILYRYFPASKQRDFNDFARVSRLISWMKKTGYRNIHCKRQRMPREESLSEFLRYAGQRHRTSQLIAISDKDYMAGLRNLEEDILRYGLQKKIPSETCLVWVFGDKPG